MAWRWLRHIKNDNIDYTFAIPYWNFSVEDTGIIIHTIGGYWQGGTGPYSDGEAALEFTANQENIDNLAFQYSSGSIITIPSKVAGGAIQYRIGNPRFPYWFSPTWYKITNYTNQENITGGSMTTGVPESSGDFTAHNQALYLCCAINDEEAVAFMGFITQGYRWQYNNPHSYYSTAGQSIYMSVGNGTSYNNPCNVYGLIASSEAGGGGGNPYEGGGYSETTDETGDFDETSDIIEEPTLPASLAVSSGFLTVYNPTYTQVVDLGNYVWNSLPLDTFKKMFANPMDVIIGLSIFPFLIDDDGRNWEIMIGNINSHVTARKARNQFQVVDCGKLYIKPYSKSYLDYSPYTKIELALPYIGTKQLDTDIIMGKWIWVKYRVDLISGGCMAILSFSDTENGEYSVIAEYTGKCNIEIPISGSDFRELGRGILQAVAGTGAILLSNGAVGGDWVGSGLANLVTGMKPNIERSGGLTSCIGLLGVQKPRIIKTIPRQCVPENQAQLQGYPVLIKDNFANLQGFTSFEEVSIKGARMTEREKQRAKALLESGVIK